LIGFHFGQSPRTEALEKLPPSVSRSFTPETPGILAMENAT
jgi:polysaccharide deacetylase 2 family uncharacterized protein YibQ